MAFSGKLYPPKAIVGIAYKYYSGTPLTPNECKNSELLRSKLQELGFEVVIKETNNLAINIEISQRHELFNLLESKYGTLNLEPKIVNDLRIYYGGRGIWIDKSRTSNISEEGITVGLLHTGKHYADDMTEEGVLYHYPGTKRPGQDRSDIVATKNAGELQVPVFVIAHSKSNGSKRDVRLAWIEDWDDQSNLFLVTFGTSPPPHVPNEQNNKHDDLGDFYLTQKDIRQKSKTKIRNSNQQQRFKMQLLKRYGPYCAVCGIGFSEMLIGAHLHPVERDGSYDPRNGLILCANHHIAFDKGLFSIDPSGLAIQVKKNDTTLDELQIRYFDLSHLPVQPEPIALEYRWGEFMKNQ